VSANAIVKRVRSADRLAGLKRPFVIDATTP